MLTTVIRLPGQSYVLLLCVLFYFWHFAAQYLRAPWAEGHETLTYDLKCVNLGNVDPQIWGHLPQKCWGTIALGA